MTVRERVLVIRLLEKQERNPEYFEKLEIKIRMREVKPPEKEGGK